jgi:hypothetical protein
MAAEQGPREAGMRPASSAGRRHVMRALRCDAKEAAPIAVEQGPATRGCGRRAGQPANTHTFLSRRWRKEAAC